MKLISYMSIIFALFFTLTSFASGLLLNSNPFNLCSYYLSPGKYFEDHNPQLQWSSQKQLVTQIFESSSLAKSGSLSFWDELTSTDLSPNTPPYQIVRIQSKYKNNLKKINSFSDFLGLSEEALLTLTTDLPQGLSNPEVIHVDFQGSRQVTRTASPPSLDKFEISYYVYKKGHAFPIGLVRIWAQVPLESEAYINGMTTNAVISKKVYLIDENRNLELIIDERSPYSSLWF